MTQACADDLPTDLAAEAIWNIVSSDFKNVALWSTLEDRGSSQGVLGQNLSRDEVQKVRRNAAWC
jgi:hypothetical protein